MRRFDDLKPEEMPDVVGAAIRQAEQDRDREMDRAAYEQAAQEMGVSREHLDRAAADMHAARVEEIRRGRTLRNRLLALAAGVALMTAGYFVINPPAPDPTEYRYENPAQAWTDAVNPRSSATVGVEGGRGVIQVERFVPEGDGRYWANLNTTAVPQSMRGYSEVTLRVRGDGTLRKVRLFLENGPNERWRSPDIAVGPEWRTVRLRLDRFEHQTRDGGADRWRTRGQDNPGDITQISLKAGYPFNPQDARGRVETDDLRIE